jgi:hypothetical protein
MIDEYCHDYPEMTHTQGQVVISLDDITKEFEHLRMVLSHNNKFGSALLCSIDDKDSVNLIGRKHNRTEHTIELGIVVSKFDIGLFESFILSGSRSCYLRMTYLRPF